MNRIDEKAVHKMADDTRENDEVDFAVPGIFRVFDHLYGPDGTGKNESENRKQCDDAVLTENSEVHAVSGVIKNQFHLPGANTQRVRSGACERQCLVPRNGFGRSPGDRWT